MGVFGEERGLDAYIRAIMDMYNKVKTKVRTSGGDTGHFLSDIGLHQGSTFNLFLFTIVMYELTKGSQDEISWCMVFANDIVLIDENRDGLNSRLELWRHTLEFRGFRLSRSKTEYLQCQFSGDETGDEELNIGDVAVPRVEKFKYLGSIIQERVDIDEDINCSITMGWQK